MRSQGFGMQDHVQLVLNARCSSSKAKRAFFARSYRVRLKPEALALGLRQLRARAQATRLSPGDRRNKGARFEVQLWLPHTCPAAHMPNRAYVARVHIWDRVPAFAMIVPSRFGSRVSYKDSTRAPC